MRPKEIVICLRIKDRRAPRSRIQKLRRILTMVAQQRLMTKNWVHQLPKAGSRTIVPTLVRSVRLMAVETNRATAGPMRAAVWLTLTSMRWRAVSDAVTWHTTEHLRVGAESREVGSERRRISQELETREASPPPRQRTQLQLRGQARG